MLRFLLLAGVVAASTSDLQVFHQKRADCLGYKATNVHTTRSSLTADLTLASPGCSLYGPDVETLRLNVVYETDSRIHVKIADKTGTRYEVPNTIFPRPSSEKAVSSGSASIQFKYVANPFSFSIVRAKSGGHNDDVVAESDSSGQEVLFDTRSYPLIFEAQYLRLKTSLPLNPNIYGLGEHTDSFRLPNTNYVRTMWSRDAYGIAPGSNLYGNHPIYFEHRTTGTHGVFLLNSNGMDIKLDTVDGKSTLEYNIIGGILDLYFLAGPSPLALAKQYAQLAGTPAEVPYWSFGFHQCRYGYKDYVDVAHVIANYSAAGIPLETMWTDIDYMFERRVFTNDPNYFPTNRVRDIVSKLHSNDQHYIVMVDPAVAHQPNQNYAAFDDGVEAGIFLKEPNGTLYKGVVWPGVTVYPDWFHPKVGTYWNNQFKRFFNPETGIDIDGVWIDMNEPANFATLGGGTPEQQAKDQGNPPPRKTPPPPPDAPIFTKRQASNGTNYLTPPYAIKNAVGEISAHTARTDLVHANGLVEYDTHNLFGTMMSTATRDAMLARRPGLRPTIITRSTFAGAGAHVGKWLGDNFSEWAHYRFSIAGILGFASIYQLPMVGADVCGFAGNTTENLCARWATLGAFYPFYRNHNADDANSQEFYRWPTVMQAAKNAIDIRYRLLDYMYTSFHAASLDGTPVLSPLWYFYPNDASTFAIEHQFFYGSSVLISPVLEEGSTSVDIYLPNDIFYDFKTFAPVQGKGSTIALTDVGYTEIPVHIKGGAILPLRIESAMTTVLLRKKDFHLVVAPGMDGKASGSLYVDDGVSLSQPRKTEVEFTFKNKELNVEGRFAYETGVKVAKISFLDVANAPKSVAIDGKQVNKGDITYDAINKVVHVKSNIPFQHSFSVKLD